MTLQNQQILKRLRPLLYALGGASLLTTTLACHPLKEASRLRGNPDSGKFIIKSVNSGMCLDIPHANTEKGVIVTQFPCNGSDAQVFELRKNYDGDYQILTFDGKRVFDINGNDKTPGVKIQLWDANGGDNQLFSLEKEGADQYFIRSKLSGLVLDVENISKEAGAQILQWNKTGAENQRWTFERFNPDAKPKTIELTSHNHVYFKGDDNQREKRFTVNFPDSTDGYAKVNLHFKLSCPDGHCDAWDRTGSFGIYSNQHDKKYLELLRFMTPYGMGGEWDLDVTDFLPLFKGTQEFRLFIDTWVGPGSSSGNGWLVDLSLDFTPGYAAEKTVLILPILSMEDIAYGDPSRSTARKANIVPLLGYKSAKIVSIITGHGQGNAQNCAEFCAKEHSITIGKAKFGKTIWRDDCATTTSQSQGGNSVSGRAGWCPGDIVRPWSEDVTAAVASQEAVLTYDVEAYENTCRPDAGECKGCVFDTPCAYDGGLHTDPKFYVTSYLIYKN